MPVHMLTTSAMSSSVTTGRSLAASSCQAAAQLLDPLLALRLFVAQAGRALVVLAGDRLVLLASDLFQALAAPP